MAQGGSNDQIPRNPHNFCDTCKIVCDSEEGHEQHVMLTNEEATKHLQQQFVASSATLETHLNQLKLLHGPEIKLDISQVDLIRYHLLFKEISQIYFDRLNFNYPSTPDAKIIRIASWNLEKFSYRFIIQPNKTELVSATIIHL